MEFKGCLREQGRLFFSMRMGIKSYYSFSNLSRYLGDVCSSISLRVDEGKRERERNAFFLFDQHYKRIILIRRTAQTFEVVLRNILSKMSTEEVKKV